jgi:hypothetical protein
MPIDPRIPLSVFSNQVDPVQNYGQIQQLRSLASRKKLEDLQVQQEQMKLSELARQQQEAAGVRQAAANAVTPAQTNQVSIPGVSLGQYGDVGGHTDSLTSPPQFDRSKMLSNLAANPQTAAEVPQYQAEFAKQDLALQQQLMAIKTAQVKLSSDQADALTKHADLAGRYAEPVAEAEKQGLPPEQIAPIYQQSLQAAAQSGVDVSTLPPTYVPGIGQRTVQQAMSVKDAVAANHQAQQAAETATHNRAEENQKTVNTAEGVFQLKPDGTKGARLGSPTKALVTAPLPGNGLDDAAVDQAAKLYLQTGQMPSLGMGAAGAGLRTKIMNRAAQLNGSADIAQNKVGFSTYQDQAKKAQPQFVAIGTANQHLDLVGQAAKALDNGNVQALNNIANSYGVAVGKDPKTTFDAIVTVAGPEVVKASASSGQMAESEIQKVRNNLQSGMSPKQIESNVAALRGLMEGKYKALQKNLNDLKGGNVTGGNGNNSPASPGAQSSHPFFNQLGGTVVNQQ